MAHFFESIKHQLNPKDKAHTEQLIFNAVLNAPDRRQFYSRSDTNDFDQYGIFSHPDGILLQVEKHTDGEFILVINGGQSLPYTIYQEQPERFMKYLKLF